MFEALYAREGVANRLARAAADLFARGYVLEIQDAYRHPDIQEGHRKDYREAIQAENPLWTPDQVEERVAVLVHPSTGPYGFRTYLWGCCRREFT